MLIYIMKRLVSGLVLLLVVGIGTFFLTHLAIPDPTASLVGKTATQQALDAQRARIGIDRPLLVQFWDWFSNLAFHGDFGRSWQLSNESINRGLAQSFPVTFSVVVVGLVLMVVIGAGLGVIAGLRPGGIWDRVISWCSIVFFSIPGFLVSVALMYLLAVQVRVFPSGGYVKLGTNFGGWLSHLILPSLSLALGGIVLLAVQLRNAIVTANGSDYARTLRSRGLGRSSLALHLLRNAAPATITIVALMLVSLLGGAIILEQMFALPGIGVLTNKVSTLGDIPYILALTLLSVGFVVVVNLALDIVLAWVNPKARVR